MEDRTLVNIADLFWGRVDIRGDDECWEWNARRSVAGYGIFWVPEGALLPGLSPQNHKASRVAYFLTHRRWPGELFVCHSCDNPPCVNPSHLWLGTAEDNNRDMTVKGRARRGELDEAKVAEICDLTRMGVPVGRVARAVGVSRPTVYRYLKSGAGSL